MNNKPIRLLLAPMEGVADWVMRDVITALGGVDQCVSEFLRVTDKLHPNSVFFKNCPELKTKSRTRAGTPVFVQLLGGQAEPLALNARRAFELGALGIDLNFGCPAKTVNRHDGGASLLKCPDRLFKIIKEVRTAIPAETPVTAKIRLGFDDPSVCLENALAAEEAGATWLTVHCRTKTNGYKPPAFWEWIPKIKAATQSIPIIANGDIFNFEDFKKCEQVTGCNQFMLGRAIMRDPFVFQKIKSKIASEAELNLDPKINSRSQPQEFFLSTNKSWDEAKSLLPQFFEASTVHINDHFATSRTKQWLKGLSIQSEPAKAVFDEIKVITKPKVFRERLEFHCLST